MTQTGVGQGKGKLNRLWICFLAVAGLLWLIDGFTAGWAPGAAVSASLTAIELVAIRRGIAPATHLRGVATVALAFWGLFYLSNLIEAAAFHILSAAQARKGALVGLAIATAAAGLLEALSARTAARSIRASEPARGAAWRFPLLAFAFLVTYLAAGIAIQPWIMSFYAGRFLPSTGELVPLILFRGLLDVACVYPWVRQWVLTRGKAALVSAYGFTVLCGWGPLLLPSHLIPPAIRAAHAVEMASSGIVFGALVAWLLVAPASESVERETEDTAAATSDAQA